MKTEQKESVLKDWVIELPFTMQAVLISSVRGADGIGKYHPSKEIVRIYRDVVLKAAYPNYNPSLGDTFMNGNYFNFESAADNFFKDVDSLPHHYIMHVIHAAQIIGELHPDEAIRAHWHSFYKYSCKCLHMRPETLEELKKRLSY